MTRINILLVLFFILLIECSRKKIDGLFYNKKDTVIDFDGKKFVHRNGKYENLENEIGKEDNYFSDF